MLSSRFIKCIVLTVALLGVGSFASASLIVAPPPPEFSMTMQSGSNSPYLITGAVVTPIPIGDKWQYQVEGSYTRAGYEVTYLFTVDPDPSVFGNIIFKNLTAAPGDYSMNFNLDITQPFNPANLSGSVGLTLTNDSNGTATASSIAPDPIYAALLDGVVVKKLLDNPFLLTVPFANDSDTRSDRFGIPIPTSYTPGVSTQMRITLHVGVSAGDQVGITSNFTANPVPEPASMLGLVIGGIGLMLRGRRR